MTEGKGPGESPIDFDAFDAITFDCYGTLIDWERGLLAALDTLMGPARREVDDDTLLEAFGRLESAAESGPFRSYRDVLTDVAHGFGVDFSVEVDDERAARFAASVGDWSPFEDTVAALRALAVRYRLAVVSNVDDDLFAGSAARLGVAFDEVVTALQVQSYKPARAHFDEVLDRLALPRERVLHVAQSLYHDVAPARALGFTTVWVNRRAEKEGQGATPPTAAKPHLEVPDLATLVRLAGL